MVDLVKANHTGRELELMLEGRKPLAMFYAEIGELPDEELIPEGRFSPHIDSGRFVRGETLIDTVFHPVWQRNVRIKYVLYALKEEAGRIEEMSALLQAAASAGWSESFERKSSALLGYSEAEINAWCAAAFPSSSKSG